jgi:polyhydroxyalkanoate synthesis regulator phasin
MAKRKASSRKPATNQVLVRLQDNMKRLQHEAEDLLKRTQQEATSLISRDQRRALDRLFNQAQRLRTDLEKRAQRASKDVESRAERLLSTLEKEAGRRMGPLLKRLDLPSRNDIRALTKRVARLERELAARDPGAPGMEAPAVAEAHRASAVEDALPRDT